MILLIDCSIFVLVCWVLIKIFGFKKFYIGLWIVGGFLALFGSILTGK